MLNQLACSEINLQVRQRNKLAHNLHLRKKNNKISNSVPTIILKTKQKQNHMMPFRFFCTFGTDISNVTFRHPSSQQRVPVLLSSRGSVCAGADGSVRTIRIQLDFKRFSHHPSPLFFNFFFCLCMTRGFGDRYNSARHTLKKVAAATLEITCEILARSNIVSLIRVPLPARPGRHDDAKKKSPGRQRGERPFCKRTGYS